MVKGILIKIGFLSFAVFFAFIIFEVVLRLFVEKPPSLAKLQASNLYLHENIPNSDFKFYSRGEFDNAIHINSYGFRDSEFSLEKEEGVFRIAVLGDSQEEALQVPLEKTWQKVMAMKLTDSLEASDGAKFEKVETYTFAVSGYGTDQHWLLLSEKVWQFKPDMVLLSFSPNDVGDVYKNKIVRISDDGEIDKVNLDKRLGGNILGRFVRRTYTYHKLNQVAQSTVLTKRVANKIRVKVFGFAQDERIELSDAQLIQGPFEAVASQKNPPKEVLDTWTIVKALILDMKKQADSHGAKFMISVKTPRAQVEEGDWNEISNIYKLPPDSTPYEIDKVLEAFTAGAGLNFYDLREDAIVWKKENGIIHFPLDAHFNEAGNELYGTKVADFILGKGLIR